jgi:hypothetical protein
MATAIESPEYRHVDELARLFYLFRVSELNRRYYLQRFAAAKSKEKGFRIAIAVLTAASFAVLSFATDFTHVKLTAGILSFLAFLISVILPGLSFERRLEEASVRTCAWHYATEQLQIALRSVKNAEDDGQAAGWAQCAEEAYHQVAALPDLDVDDVELIRKIEDQVKESFPSDYVWTAF